jgi:predicted MPP superfamily phosphohydrolase
MFSGHTHGGQFGVKTESFQWSPVEYRYKEWAGLYPMVFKTRLVPHFINLLYHHVILALK